MDAMAEEEENKPKSPSAASTTTAAAAADTSDDAGTATTTTTTTTTTLVLKEEDVKEEEDAQLQPEATTVETQPTQQIFIIQTTDGSVPMESAEVVVAEDLAVYETVSALEQLSRGQVVTTSAGGDLIQVYEEVVLPDAASGSVIDQFVDVAEVEVGDGRSASPVKIETVATKVRQGGNRGGAGASATVTPTVVQAAAGGGEYHICRLCSQFVALSDIGEHNRLNHGHVSDLTCLDCGKLFKSKRSLFGHRKEKHSGVTEVHHCPECGKSFGRKSNLKAHRESLHYGKKFPCSHCERVFTNRSSMNQHIKKTHVVPDAANFIVQQE